MLKLLLAVDGSESALRATRKLLQTLDWYKSPPHIDLVSVQLPVPHFEGMGVVVNKAMIDRYYAEESARMHAPSKALLEAAGATFAEHTLVGQIAETLVHHARESGADMIYMGTRGMTPLGNMVLGSTAAKVLHLATMPVVLIH